MSTSNNQLDPTIEDFLSTFEETSKKEIKFVVDNNWSLLEDRKTRISRHDLEVLLVERNVSHAIKLFALCKGDTKHPRIKSIMEVLLKFFKIYEGRKESYLKKENWLEYLDKGLSEVDVRAEIEFQSSILKNIAEYKEKLRKINFGEDSTVIDIPIHANTPIPLMMSDVIEERYPEIKEFIEKKRELLVSSSAKLPKDVKKKTTKKKKE